jgi:hypothetical protein
MKSLETDTDDSQPATCARVFDALIGGVHNFTVDRRVARQLLDADPSMRWWAATHPLFRARAITMLADIGIRQWVDLGCGWPTADSTYDLLHAGLAPGSRLVCLDRDPAVVAYLKSLSPPAAAGLTVAAVRGDLADPRQVIAAIASVDVVDLGEPVAVLCTGVLHHLTDLAAAALLASLRDNVVAGSYLVLSHPSRPEPFTGALDTAIRAGQAATGTTWTLRDIHAAPHLLTGGWTPLPPGCTPVGEWRYTADPDDEDLTDAHPIRAAAGWAVLATAAPGAATADPGT